MGLRINDNGLKLLDLNPDRDDVEKFFQGTKINFMVPDENKNLINSCDLVVLSTVLRVSYKNLIYNVEIHNNPPQDVDPLTTLNPD